MKTALVQHLYRMFGEGNIPGIVDHLTGDIVWIDAGAPAVPYAGTYTGKEQVAQFFQKMGSMVQLEKFEPRAFVETGDKVVALGHLAGKSAGRGAAFATDWAMVWTFDGDKVKHFQSYVDTANLANAF